MSASGPRSLNSEGLHQQSSGQGKATCLGIFGRKVFSMEEYVLTELLEQLDV